MDGRPVTQQPTRTHFWKKPPKALPEFGAVMAVEGLICSVAVVFPALATITASVAV